MKASRILLYQAFWLICFIILGFNIGVTGKYLVWMFSLTICCDECTSHNDAHNGQNTTNCRSTTWYFHMCQKQICLPYFTNVPYLPGVYNGGCTCIYICHILGHWHQPLDQRRYTHTMMVAICQRHKLQRRNGPKNHNWLIHT